ncbi:RNA methyltransferase [Kocuria sediminis]|uniref:RNA methyltransferase n=1 Tax=Kocuria sediminis TaxID=1038857 RepID=A0A6N8GKC9_9MICC|nr:RNA methyltransferase [Kocuria sediminis]
MNLTERLADRPMSNPRADRVRDVAGLAGRSARSKRGLFLAEGPQNAREALARHLESPCVDAVYVTGDALAQHPDITALLERVAADRAVFVRLVTREVLAAMSDAVSPQGVVVVCRSLDVPAAGILRPAPQLVAVLARVQDPGNAGTLLRAADAAGADALVLSTGSVDVYNPKAVRSTAGSLFHLPVAVGADLPELVRAARAAGCGILAADGRGDVDLDRLQDLSAARAAGAPVEDTGYDLARPTVWLFGNEAQGLSEEEKALADHRVAVPVYGRAESLNVGTAATVCLYASARAQRRAGRAHR